MYNTRYQIKKAFKQLKQNEHNKIDQLITHNYNTRYKYPQTRFSNAHWLSEVIENYEEHTGVLLSVE